MEIMEIKTERFVEGYDGDNGDKNRKITYQKSRC